MDSTIGGGKRSTVRRQPASASNQQLYHRFYVLFDRLI
jgi:hypothetical protein